MARSIVAPRSSGNERLAVLVPVLGRPHRVSPLLDAFLATTPDCEIFLIADRGDRAEIRAVKRDGRARLLICGGTYAQKINFAVQRTDHPLLFLGADDLEPQRGWLAAAKRRLRRRIGMVGVNDLIERNREHATHFLMTRAYASRPTIDGQPGPCCTAYAHWKIDDELIATAKSRNAYAYAPDAHVRHLHYLNNLAPDDDTYQKGRQRRSQDIGIFQSRRRLWEAGSVSRVPGSFDQFTIGVASYGSRSWRELARRRAVPSAESQGVPVIHVHGSGTLAEARNEIIAQAQTEFLILLDADDELERGYVAAMAQGSADVRVPRVRQVRDMSALMPRTRAVMSPYMPQVVGHRHAACRAVCLRDGNWIVIGAAARTALLRQVGGFHEEPIWEDWALWLRCYVQGATFQPIRRAIYRQHMNEDSRNAVGDVRLRNHWRRKIRDGALDLSKAIA